MTTELNFQLLKAAYYELIRQYMQLLNQVSERKTDSILRIMVEDHIRIKLHEIEKSMQLIVHRFSAEIDQDEIEWLKIEANRCAESASHLSVAQNYITTLWGAGWRVAVAIFIISALIRFRQLSSLNEVFLNIDMLSELISSNLFYIVSGSVAFMFIMVVLMFMGYAEKRRLFAPGYNPLFGYIENVEVVNSSKIVYQLEDQLFQEFGRDKRPEFKIDIPFILVYGATLSIFIIYPVRGTFVPLLGELWSWIVSGILIAINFLVFFEYIRKAAKRNLI